MSEHEKRPTTTLGGMDRRELLSALARWTVPTVLTLSLAVREARAAASCPPCTKKQGSGSCRACNMNQMLNCQCEPCLGPPYCTSGAAPQPGFAPAFRQSPGSTGGASPELVNALRRRKAALLQQEDPLASPFARPLPGARTDSAVGTTPRGPYGRDTRSPVARGLYDRLRRPDDRR